jgi:hypothetical protein
MGELGRACGLTYNETNQIKQAAHYCATLARVWSALASSVVLFRCCLRGDKDYVYRLDPGLSARNERTEVWLTVHIVPAFAPLSTITENFDQRIVSHERQGLWLVRVKNSSTDVIGHGEQTWRDTGA